MSFLEKIKASIYSPPFYKEIPKKSFGSSIGYFLLLTLCLVLIRSLFLVKPLIVDFNKEAKKYAEKALNYYPANLVITSRNGSISTNVPEPYFIPFPVKNDQKQSGSVSNLVVIDTKTPYSAGQFAAYESAVWVTADSIFYKSDREIKTADLTKIGDFNLDKKLINTVATKVLPYLNFLGPLLFTLAFLGLYLSYSFRLTYLIIFALVILLAGKILRKNFSYGGAYKIGLYAMTLGFLTEIIVEKTSSLTGFSGFPFMFSLVTLAIVVLNFSPEK